jgi:hypothetical protein
LEGREVTRGIYLVANRRVERSTSNLIYSIRRSGCTLPILLIPFDDDVPTDRRVREDATLLPVESFPAEARRLVELSRLWPRTPAGLFRRFLAWYGPFDEFIYSDNDIVALGDWTAYLEHLSGFDLVHADREYTTGGRYNYPNPGAVERELGADAINRLLTAGHFAAHKRKDITAVFERTLAWIRQHPGIVEEHDQAFLNLAVVLGPLRTQNLCRTHQWPSSWAGDYRNSLHVVQTAQGPGRLLHLHYSGGTSGGYAATEDFLQADSTDAERLRHLTAAAFQHWSGLHYLRGRFARGLRRRLKKLIR